MGWDGEEQGRRRRQVQPNRAFAYIKAVNAVPARRGPAHGPHPPPPPIRPQAQAARLARPSERPPPPHLRGERRLDSAAHTRSACLTSGRGRGSVQMCAHPSRQSARRAARQPPPTRRAASPSSSLAGLAWDRSSTNSQVCWLDLKSWAARQRCRCPSAPAACACADCAGVTRWPGQSRRFSPCGVAPVRLQTALASACSGATHPPTGSAPAAHPKTSPTSRSAAYPDTRPCSQLYRKATGKSATF